MTTFKKLTFLLILFFLTACAGGNNTFENAEPLSSSTTHTVEPTKYSATNGGLTANEGGSTTETTLESVEITSTTDVTENVAESSNTPTSVEESTADPSPTPVPTPEPLEPDTILRCPEQRELLFSELNLDEMTNLIVRLQNDATDSLWRLNVDKPTPQIITSTTPENNTLYRFQDISPDGRWLAFYKSQPGDDLFSLWISSIDGSNQWQAALINKKTLIRWSSERQILILESIDGQQSPTLVAVLDPFSGEIETLDPLPASTLIYNSSISRTLYYDGDHWMQYNYRTHSEQIVLQWLENEDWLYSDPFTFFTKLWIGFDDNLENTTDLVIMKPYGLDVALNLDFTTVSQATEYLGIMKPITLPADSLETRLLRWLDEDTIIVDRFEPPLVKEQPHFLFSLDIANLVLYDYCLDRGNAGSPQLSQDGRFLAWTVFTGSSHATENAKEIMILELETGLLARLPEMELVG